MEYGARIGADLCVVLRAPHTQHTHRARIYGCKNAHECANPLMVFSRMKNVQSIKILFHCTPDEKHVFVLVCVCVHRIMTLLPDHLNHICDYTIA